MKDYASRMDWYEGRAKPKPWLRWALLVAFVIVLIAAFATHKSEKKKAAPAVVAAKAEKAKPITQPVQFDFYHVLTKNNGEKITTPAAATPANTMANTTATTTAQTTATQVQPAPAKTPFAVTFGSFKTKAGAENKKASLILSGVAPDSVKVVQVGQAFNVQSGPFATKTLAQNEVQTLAKQNVASTVIQTKQ